MSNFDQAICCGRNRVRDQLARANARHLARRQAAPVACALRECFAQVLHALGDARPIGLAAEPYDQAGETCFECAHAAIVELDHAYSFYHLAVRIVRRRQR